MTVERDLSRLRFLTVRVSKGEVLTSEDIDFMMKQCDYLNTVVCSLNETLELLRDREKQL